jgi:VWFA-related protein
MDESEGPMIIRRFSSVLVLALALVPRAGAPSDSAAPVVLDLVARDKKNVPVADLRAEEVELYEDGVKQAFEDFRRVAIPPAAAGGAATTGAAPDSARLAVFLFPKLPRAERDLALSAAEEFVKKQLVPGMSVAVLLVGPELVPIQGFTPDAAVLKDAIRRALDPAARSGDPDVRALYSLVQWLKGQPGRKTVLLFSSGLGVPPGFEDSAQDVMGLANQQRISFYGVDPRGLEISRGGIRIDQQAASDGEDAARGKSGVTTELGNYIIPGGVTYHGGQGPSFGPSSQDASSEALARLAQGTGGFVLERTNSFSKGMKQIAEDASGYYQLRYTPTATKPEGQFRKMEVRVTREGVRVQARQQYLVGEMAAALVPAFEKQLTEALAADRLPSDVELWERALHFGWDGKELVYVLWVSVPLEKVSLAESTPAGRFEGDVSILARVKDASGKVVATFSQRFPIGGPKDQLARAHTMSIPFVRRVALVPGEYTLETAVQDGRGGKLTARRTPLTVHAPQGIVLSSLSLGDLLPPGSGSDPEDPLRVGNQRLIPNLGQPIKAGRPAMTLHSAVFPLAGSKEPAQIAITLLLGDQPANNATAVLPAPDASGKIAYATALRMDVLPPGSYRFKVAVTQGASRAEESLSFTIVP